MIWIFSCCVVVQEGMQELYDNSITDKDTDGKLLNWAVATHHDSLRDYHNYFDFVRRGMHHCCHAALKLVEQGRIASWVCGCAVTVLSPYRTHELRRGSSCSLQCQRRFP